MKKIWVIWGKTNEKELLFHTAYCKAPERTKLYRGLEKRFNSCELERFGFVSYEEYEKQGYWLSPDTKGESMIKQAMKGTNLI